MTKTSWKIILTVLIVAFTLNGARAQEQGPAKKAKGNSQSIAAVTASSVTGSGTPGQITKWTGVSGSTTYTIGDSIITEDKFGKVGIGTRTPSSPLTVAGIIETTQGGYKFPDGTVQTTAGVAPTDVVRSLNGFKGNLLLAGGANITVSSAGNTITVAAPNALTTVAHDATVTGNGTTASPLSVVQAPGEASQPFQVELQGSATFTVPMGKRLVIEYVGVDYAVPTTPLLHPIDVIGIKTQIGAAAAVQHFVLTYKGSENAGFTDYLAGQIVKFYADPGTEVKAVLPSMLAGSIVTLSGHYVNVP